ncbi:hypothetical protein [Thiorhodococcus minor]|uniref:Uncharacterized protein n=1 Tax=Thiorhodococcus minor TaxID=57489 RepID=A0A6M0K4K9_9GAMM|nr:hypothetical protein [Thiorhodococcus minor]NEV64359.1 hypothetical protein [Thiorhodococcus minor]
MLGRVGLALSAHAQKRLSQSRTMIASASIAAEEMPAMIGLGAALGIGLLFGVERGWRATLKQDASRHAAGVRT